MSKVNLETFAGGALQEKFDDAMDKVLVNMMDPNTPWKNKRKISVEITFEQDEDRSDTAVNVAVIAKLAPVKPIGTRMAIGKNLKTGEVFAEEYGSQCRGQMTLDDLQKQKMSEVDGKVIDTETGEIIEQKPQSVVDFRAVKQA